MLRNPRRAFITATGTDEPRDRPFATGVLTNLLNPKVGLFYVSFLPQFHALLGQIWFACLIAATRPIALWLTKPAVVQACDRLTGGVFVAFGLGLALGSRRS
jgi:threonine/homoserine/homoserine lactone efflux protein